MITLPHSILRIVTPLLRLVRVWNLFFLACIQIIASLYIKVENPNVGSLFFNEKLWLLLLGTTSTAAAGYIINDYYDVKIDAINMPERMVIDRTLGRRYALLMHLILVIISLLCAFFLGWKYFILAFLGNGLLWYYSNSLKRLPLIGNLSLGIMTLGGLYSPALILKEPSTVIMLFAISGALNISFRSLLKDVRDLKGDRKFKLNTLPIKKGVVFTKKVLSVLAIAQLIVLGVMLMLFTWDIAQALFFVSILLWWNLFNAIKTNDTQKHYSSSINLSKWALAVSSSALLLACL